MGSVRLFETQNYFKTSAQTVYKSFPGKRQGKHIFCSTTSE